MAKGYPINKVSLQFYDGTATTPATLDIVGYSDVPEIGDVYVTRDLNIRTDRGKLSHVMYGEDGVDFPEVTLTVDMIDTYMSANGNVLENWFTKHMAADGTTPLVSTNDGNAQARDLDTGELITFGLPTDIFTVGLKLQMEDTSAAGSFGRDYKYVKLVGSPAYSASIDGVSVSLTIQLLGTYTEI